MEVSLMAYDGIDCLLEPTNFKMRLICILSIMALISCNSSKNLATAKGKISPQLKEQIQLQRAEQRDSRIEDKAVLNIEELSYFEMDASYSVTAQFKAAEAKSSLEIPTSSGKKKEFYHYGTLFFTMHGIERQLNIYRNIASMRHPKYKNYLFLPFTDDTNGEETYGGGRYIDLKIEDIKESAVTIDFNTAYSPYCAYGDGWNCPIPPIENYLSTKVMAGEKAFTGTKSNRK